MPWAPGHDAIQLITEVIYCKIIDAGKPAICAAYGVRHPAKPTANINNMVNGISGRTRILAISAYAEYCPKDKMIMGKVTSCADNVSTRICLATPGFFRPQIQRWTSGANAITPANDTNDKYQPISP